MRLPSTASVVWSAPSDVSAVEITRLGKNYPTDIAARAGMVETLRGLGAAVETTRSQQQAAAAKDRMASLVSRTRSKQRESLITKLQQAREKSPMDPQE